MKTLIAAAVLGTTALGGIAYATQTAQPAKHAKADANGDGAVSRAEFLAGAEAKFARLDTDRNGSLSTDERRAGHMGHGKRVAMGGPFGAAAQDTPTADMGKRGPGTRGMGLARLDTDGDGRITRAEFDAQSGTRFARMDTNGDGIVDKTEMAAMRGGGRMAGRIDADGSGTLTRAEYDALSGKRFARMDGNDDGVIDTAEQAAMPRGPRAGAATPPPPPPSAPNGG